MSLCALQTIAVFHVLWTGAAYDIIQVGGGIFEIWRTSLPSLANIVPPPFIFFTVNWSILCQTHEQLEKEYLKFY